MGNIELGGTLNSETAVYGVELNVGIRGEMVSEGLVQNYERKVRTNDQSGSKAEFCM